MTDRPLDMPQNPSVLTRLRVLLDRADTVLHHDPVEALAADLATTKRRLARVEAQLEAAASR